jgi:ankyrin repeat protein
MTTSSSASVSDDFELIDHQEANLEPEDLLSRLQGWLQPTDYTAESSEFHRHLSSQAPGTGLWICDTTRYQQWHQSDDHSSLWVKGVPGAGKSVIAASIVEHLQITEDVPVLFFFFRYIIASNRKPRNLIQDYLTQLLPRCPKLRAILQPLLDSELDHLSDERLWEFLLLGLASIEKAYCIVDAMDEMEVDDTFLQRLNDLATFRPKSVKLFMTSRPKQYLQSALRDASIVHISLEDNLVGKDIAVFVAHRLKNVLSGDQNQQLREDLESTICERPRGLFLYARLLVDQIIPKLHATGQLDVQKLAKTLPVGLEDMYNTMLYQNTQSIRVETDIQVFLLQLVTHSSRALRLNELANVLASEFPGQRLHDTPKNVARTACAPLLEILEDETVQVIHHSFTEFLLDQERLQNLDSGSTPQFPVLDPHNVHRNLAMISLRYLQSGVLRHPDAEEFEKQLICKCEGDIDCTCHRQQNKMKDPYDLQASKLKYPFLEYAILNWAYHCQKYDEDDQEFLHAVSDFLYPESLDFKRWLRIEWTTRQVPGAVRSPTPLHVAAFAGMTKYAALLLQADLNVDPKDADERTPLHWACRRGHIDMVSLLLKNGAEADAEDCRGVKPILEAASRNHSGIVKLLLEAGVNPMTPKTKENRRGRLRGGSTSTRGETAPEYACKQGHLDTIMVLLPYLKPESLPEVLGRACRHGEFEIAKAVLNSTPVSPNAKFDGGTPLYIATVALNISIVELLLSKGADPLGQCDYAPDYRMHGGGRYGRAGPLMAPLHALASNWNEDTRTCQKILTMLRKAGADIEAKNGNGFTPLMSLFALQSYRFSPSYDQVRCFLEAGADISTTDNDGDCVLLRCLISCKNLEVIKLLFKHGAKVEVQGDKGKTVLHRVLEHPHGGASEDMNEILTFLLEKGAKPDIADVHGRTALQQAILTPTCTIETFKVLLEKCELAAVKQCMWFLGSRKSMEEEKQFIEVLLAHGASLEDRNIRGQTPILSCVRSQKVVEALRECGADIHAVDNNGQGILHLFIHKTGGCPTLEPFKIYVDYGLDLKMVDSGGNSLLHTAATVFGGTKYIVDFIEYLLDIGISMNAKNKRRETPLMVNIKLATICSSSNENRVPLVDLFRRYFI